MINNSNDSSATLRSLNSLSTVALVAILLLVAPVAGFAQGTASSIRGKIYDQSGNAVTGTSVVVEDMRTGVQREYTSNSSGAFYASNLPVGGPYEVTVAGAEPVIVASVALGDTYNLTINLEADVVVEEIVVTGTTSALASVTTGPAATYSIFDLESAVAFERDITGIYSLDPRLNLDVDGFSINCGGQHPRFNSVTLDGVSQNDRFGLNSNGYSTATGMPFPYDAIEQVVVELAPFDVTFSGFSACNINAVSKSGTNVWEFGAFYEWTNDSMRGDKIASTPFNSESYTEDKYGFSAGGPIIQDRLFIFGAYEETEEPRFLAGGYAGSGNGEERPWLSESDFNRLVNIANSVYNSEPGGQPTDGLQTNEKYMLRVDWNISDNHNAAVIYNYFDGPQSRASD
ncbi:MAG: carboxypeptidase-like regulatory domain-containing protein, partial [Proteobacteria bacterium]|nr:carboxypeptidase-like regulatory domain-containing protein [Pseudomonadota bacterium]